MAATLPYGLVRLLGGIVFSLALILIIVGGAELFTGNTMIVMAWASGKVKTGVLLSNWGLVFAGNVTGTMLTAGLMFPLTVAALPLTLLLRTLGLHGTYLGVIIPSIAFALPTTIIILVPFLRAIPDELEEAASIDGASRLGFFWRILLPLSMPGLVTVGVLAFVGSWNGYLLPLLVISTGTLPQELWPLPLGVTQFSTQYSQDTAAVLAYTSLAMIPALVFFLAAERRIVGGLQGAVKG